MGELLTGLLSLLSSIKDHLPKGGPVDLPHQSLIKKRFCRLAFRQSDGCVVTNDFRALFLEMLSCVLLTKTVTQQNVSAEKYLEFKEHFGTL